MEKANTSFPSYNELDDYLTRHNSNFVWLLVATIMSCGWIIYLTYYNSRNIGLILTLIINRLYKNGYIHIGSFSLSVLSGKVMFRDVYFINEDMSIRIQDGLLIFRWWKMYNPKQKQHVLLFPDPKAETRLYVTVNGFEFHVYNRTDLYTRLQEIFGLEPTLIPPHRDEEKGREQRDKSMESVHIKAETPDPSSSWRSLIPVIKVNISTGRVAFGNHHLPQTLCMNFDDAFLTYATKPPSSHLDQFMHIVKGSLENVRVMLVPSPRYLGLQNDEPPRLMGEGFVVMQSNDVDIYYYQDEPGLVPEELENGDTEACSEDAKLQDLPPCWGLDIVCGKGTDFNYGPWADRQRDSLWKFFLPADYQPMKVSDVATPGKPRQILAFELRMNIIADATIDLLFTKNRETNAVHVNVGAGSYLEVNIPMTVGENGYSPTVKGQLLHVDATSSMLYRTLLEAEMLAFYVIASYPRVWNMPQSWQCEIEVYKATYHFIYAQKNFFTDLIKDWASDSEPDIYSFVPYSWKFKILFHQFEMIWAANQHNWIDCSTKQQENVYLAACGETLNIDFTLPFNDFVPTTCNTRFCLRAEDTDMRLCLPDCHPSRYPLLTLTKDYQHCKTHPDNKMPAEGQGAPPKNSKPRWRNMTNAEAGWVDCWSVPNFMLIIDYTWHPIYPQKTEQQLKQSLSEIEESMLSALRPPEHSRPLPPPPRISSDPSLLPPDRLHVEMELSPESHVTLYGPLLRALVSIKENYFGEDDMYTDFEESLSSPVLSSCSSSSGWPGVGLEESRSKDTPHPLSLRPWDITVLINLHKVHGRLPTHCSSDGPEGPTGFLERLCFEMKKGYKETMLQLVLSPLHVFVSDNYQRPAVDAVLRDGHLSLSGLQMRAHAMFSAEGLPAGSDTLEYAWLIDVQAGALTGRVSVPQCASLLEWGESFVFHVVSREFQLQQPKPSVTCQHGVDRRVCDAKHAALPGPCRTSEDLKYTMTRLTVDGAQVFIVEHGCAANIKTGALRLATCNLHTAAVGEGISAVLQDVVIAQFIEQQEVARLGLPPPLLRRSHWLEAGSVTFKLITADVALAADHQAKYEVQRQFLELNDMKTKRLWFLWPEEKYKRSRNRCGCLGGCRFFAGSVGGLDFFRLEEITPSSSSAFSSIIAESDMSYGQSLLHPGEWIVTKETPKLSDPKGVAIRRETCSPAPIVDLERRGQHLSLHVPQHSHSSASSSEENSSSSAALPLLAGERESPSPSTELMNVTTGGPIPEGPPLRSPLRSPLKRQSSVQSARLGSTKSLSAAVFIEKATPPTSVQFSSEVSHSDENVLDSPRQRRSYGSFPFTPSADSSTFHQYRSVDSSMSVADSEAYFSANEEFEPISSDEGPGTYPGRKRRRRQQGQPHTEHSRTSIYHSVEGPLSIAETRPPLPPSHTSQASFVSALGLEEEGSIETEKVEPGLLTTQPHLMALYENYLAHYHVSNWAVKQPTNKRTSKSSLHRPLDLDTPTSEESSASFDQLSIPSFKMVKGGLSATSLLDRGVQLMSNINSTPHTPLNKQAVDSTDEDTVTEDWTVDQPLAQTRTTAIVEVKGAVNVVLTPLVAEALDRYIESMVHFASIRHPASILDDLHGKVLNEVYQISKSTVSESSTAKPEHKISKTEGTTPGSLSTPHGQTDLSIKPDNVKIKGLQANVTVPKVNLCVLQASVEEGSPSNKSVTHVSLVALCFDRIATQLRMNRGIVEDTEKPSVMMEKFSSASKMAPQSSGSLRSNAGIEKGKEIAARLNIHRIHSQLRGLDSSDLGACAITAIPFEKSKVLFSLEEADDFVLVDETQPSISTEHVPEHTPDHARSGASPEKWGWIMFECGIENLTVKGGRQSGAVLYSAFGVMGGADSGVRNGVSKSNGSSGSQTGSGYSTHVSDDNLPNDAQSPASEPNNNSDSDEQDEGVESDDLKKDLPLLPPPPDSSSMKLTIKEIWFSFAAPTNIRSHAPAMSRQLNLLSTATPAVGAWLVPIDQLKSSLQKLDMEATLRVCAVMGCIMTEALEKKSIHIPFHSKYNRVTKRARYLHENPSCLLCNILHRYLQQADYRTIEEATMNDELPALVTLRKGLVALARQWMKFIVVTQGFKAVGLPRPNQLPKPKEQDPIDPDQTQGLDCGTALQSDTSADGAEFEFDAGTVSEHTMLLEEICSRPAPTGNSAPVTGVEIMRKLSKSHTHSESALRIKGSHPYQSLSYTSGDTAADSPAHVCRTGLQSNHSPRKESLLSYLTGSIHSLHNLLEATPHRANEQTTTKSSFLTRTGNNVGADVLTEHPLVPEPFSVSFYNWMSNAVGNRTGSHGQDSPLNRSQHNSLQTGGVLPTIPSASDFNTVLSSDQNTLDTHSQHTHSQHSTSEDDLHLLDQDETNLCPAAVQLADAQVVFKPLLSHIGIQPQDAPPLSYKMYFGEHLSFSGTLECLRADIVDSDTSKDRKNKRAQRQGVINPPPLDFKPALMIETFSLNAVVLEKCMSTPPSASALSFHELSRRPQASVHCHFTLACQAIRLHVDMALVRLIHQFSTMIDDIKATQTDIKLNRYTAGSSSPTPTKARPYRDFRSSDFSRSSRGSLNGAARLGTQKGKRTVVGPGLDTLTRNREPRGRGTLGRSERRTSKVSRKGSRDVADHMTIQMDDSDSITVSEQSEPSAKCWQNMYKLLNFYSLISDPTGILEKNQDNVLSEVGRSPADPPCHVVYETEGETPPSRLGRRRSLVSSEPQHVTLIVFGVGMVNRTHLEADIGGLTMEAELKKIHGSFTLKEKMKDILHQKMTETCASAHIGCVNIVLLEGITPDIQLEDFPTSPTSTTKQEFLTVVKCNIAKSQALYSAQRGLKTNNAAIFKVGAILINIPQHPATLHSMMVRSSHQLSKQISDLIRQPSNIPPPNREDTPTPQPSEVSVNQTPVEAIEFPQLPEGLEKKPIVLKFSAMLDGITIRAALLPSLKAEYKMGRMKSHGMTGAQTRFTFELPSHKLCFQSKVSPVDVSAMPPTASLTLPPVTMSGQYIIQEHEGHSDTAWAPGYSNYLQGNYLRCVAEIGSFEHNLTTDLLNHLVFLQKVFMKEVNEVIQKVSGGEQPIPLWNEHDVSTDGDKPKILLYSINLTFKGIQMTATTPSMRAVRFETGWIELELSNRVQCKTTPTGSNYLKLFGKCQVDLNLALGQIVKHQVYEEAGSDFHQVAYFRTRIGLRNALKEEISGSSDKEAVLITLNRPIVFAQPVAFDRAVLFWLNYKAAFDNWKEQRLALNSDIHMATKEVVDKLPAIQQTSVQAFSTLFLQLTVNDLGICLPITSTTQANHSIDFDAGSALVLTIESTLITACSSESLVSKGHFKNFCIRFAEGFETTWDDWKPEVRGDLVMNACVVPDGTYEVCSRTTGQASAESSSAGTWTLNVLWKMCGIDVHMDPNIGKRLNALGNTLTSLTGEEDSDDITDLNSVNMADLSDEDKSDGMSPTIHSESVDLRRQAVVSNQIIDARGRKFSKRLVDIRELNEQAKVIDDLKKLGASEGTINQEIQRYQHLESVAVNDIRRDVRKKLRRSSMRAASLKDKWGLGYKPSYSNSRSKSISATGRPPMKRSDRPRDELPDIKVDAASPAPRVTFNIDTMETPNAIPSPADSVFKFPEETELDLLSVTIDDPAHYPSCSVFSAPGTPAVFSPTIPFQPDDSRRDELFSTSSEDSDKDDEFDRERPHSYYRRPGGSQRKPSALSALFSERWLATPPQRGALTPPTERNIDFELDVRVEIDSGKCVLHPSTHPPEHEDLALRRSCERSSRSLDQESPPKKRKQQHSFASSSQLLNAKRVPTSLQSKSSDIETTVFYIPGVDVKLHYNSKMLKTDSPNATRGSSLPRTFSKESKLYGMRDAPTPAASGPGKTYTLLSPPPPPLPSAAKGKASVGVKTAKLYAWVALQTLPEEMVISPCLLDFLEKALETIPITPIDRNYATLNVPEEDVGHFDSVEPLEESQVSLVSSATSPYSSFPVDVVVYVRVQPSQIRFSCLPMSRVECMLKLPSLDLVFSSNRGELEPTTHPSEGQHTPSSTPPSVHNANRVPGSKGPSSPPGRSRHHSSQSDLTGPSLNSSGLSFTACMSDFSLFVFHPYGAGKQKSAVTGLPPGPGPLGVDEEASSVTGRKDSLSINLEFVKVSLSRMRRTGCPAFIDTLIASKGGKMDTTLINISAVCDIGSASFKYDMRRLSEILAFPRAWYRRSIARRLFLGDQTINLPASGPATPDSVESIAQHLSPESSRKAYWRTWDGKSTQHPSSSVFTDATPSHAHLRSPATGRSRSVSDSSAPRRDSVTKTSTPSFRNGKAAAQQGSPWETLVVFAINLKQLNVQMNMSNVMGNNTWTTSGLKSQGRLSVGSNRDREISMSVGLGRSKLDSKGGVVGGNIDVNTLEMVSHISEHPNRQPSHKIQITMGSTEARLDYMGSSILMGIFSNADLQLQDEWKVNLCTTDASLSEKSEIFVHGDLQWDIFQVIISRSTTPDLIKIGMKLQEFFTQQFDTSKRALSTWGPVPYMPPKTPVINMDKGAAKLYMDAAHHRHWPSVLKMVAGCHISLFQMPLPEDAVQLGGSMSLHGNHMTLACFHGPNFRSKSWVLFHLEEPNIAFWTEAQKIWEDGSSDDSTYIVQTLDFHLGHNTMVTKPCGALESPMATITKVNRRRHENPPHGVATVKEWFNYVTAMRNEELNLLRNVDANNSESGAAAKSSSLLSGFKGASSYNHETETIFALPKMQLEFKSIHVQDPEEPSLSDASSKPKVECSVVTEFTDHICVTMDAELIMFLHDLVSAYLKEKEKALFAPRIFTSRPGQKSPTVQQDEASSEKRENEEGGNYTTVDWREFLCNTWHLEPTLRLISWTGRKIDPVGVDYILQKLGFHHARTTIPKWLQRGVMDPLDKVLSVLIKKLGMALQDEKEKKGHRDKEEH
ncbi:bridge-like lipid transfer protein family member 1 isoform X3 [Carassius carassius]|uniref:bridge-like lipid transfer protein family member 1 isoform X3 n=1 Tax=Carassius carassius TaxID=217509 RepID=UPI0028685C2B|nr:bridge-like lipid transfer protein family member 1 isoform X3 [Carassius carassius]